MQFEMLDWAKVAVGDPGPETWFWARHEMNYDKSVDFATMRNAVVFVHEKDALAFKLRFNV